MEGEKHNWQLLIEKCSYKFLGAIRTGAKLNIACGYAGISRHIVDKILAKAKEIYILKDDDIDVHPQKYCLDFYKKYKEAQATDALQSLKQIQKATDHDWKAAAWKLERGFPKDYGKQEVIEHKVEDDRIAKARADVERLKSLPNG
jgi:hypothetical protein